MTLDLSIEGGLTIKPPAMLCNLLYSICLSHSLWENLFKLCSAPSRPSIALLVISILSIHLLSNLSSGKSQHASLWGGGSVSLKASLYLNWVLLGLGERV